MNPIITLEPAPTWNDLVSINFRHAVLEREGDISFLGSGKAALRIVFEHLKQRHVLENKMAPIIVPPWLGTWVYATLLPFGFPTLQAPDGRVALVYHQYGFPQDMDKVRDIARTRNITIVEDCAHSCDSKYRGRQLGSFGEYAVYSYSKFAFCFALGGARGSGADFERHVQHAVSQASNPLRWCVNAFKYIDERNLHTTKPSFPRLMNGLRAMAYARYPDQIAPGPAAVGLWLSKRGTEVAVRTENYRHLRTVADHWGICDHLEEMDVVPYGVPLNMSASKARALIETLLKWGIQASSNRFDFARCLFEPDYRPCVLVPIHSQMTGNGMERLCDALIKVMR